MPISGISTAAVQRSAYARTRAAFAAVCRKVGRDPHEVEKATSLSPAQLAEPSPQVVARLRALTDTGIQHEIIELSQPYDRQFLRRFAKDILPKFQ
jgi:hypothetical protein